MHSFVAEARIESVSLARTQLVTAVCFVFFVVFFHWRCNDLDQVVILKEISLLDLHFHCHRFCALTLNLPKSAVCRGLK